MEEAGQGGPPGGGSPCPPSLSLGHNCDGTEQKNSPKARSASKQARAKETLNLNVAAAVKAWGIECVGLLTLTFKERLSGASPEDWKTAKGRVRNYRDGVLRKLYRGGVIVWEEAPETRRIHAHIIVGTWVPIRGALDFEAVKARDYRSAGPELRRHWAIHREKCPLYHLGRHELLPVRDGNAIGHYVAGYLGEDFDGSLCGRVRRVSYFGESVRVATMQAGWVNGPGAAFRHLLREMESIAGGGLARWVEAVGPRWAHRVMKAWHEQGWGWVDEAGESVELPMEAMAHQLCDVLRVPHMRPKAETGGHEWGPLADTGLVRALCEAFGGEVEAVDDITARGDALASVISPRDTLAARP